ncbi:MAG: hypothetical protein Fur0025_43710 [Oscillatoriaceae cyanobacterium]
MTGGGGDGEEALWQGGKGETYTASSPAKALTPVPTPCGGRGGQGGWVSCLNPTYNYFHSNMDLGFVPQPNLQLLSLK